MYLLLPIQNTTVTILSFCVCSGSQISCTYNSINIQFTNYHINIKESLMSCALVIACILELILTYVCVVRYNWFCPCIGQIEEITNMHVINIAHNIYRYIQYIDIYTMISTNQISIRQCEL